MTTLLTLALISGATAAAAADALRIDADFPGGNIVVERIERDEVWVHQDPRDTPAFWFYWNLRVRGAGGRTLTFHFTQGNVIGACGPAISRDGGRSWAWLGLDACQEDRLRCTFGPDEADTRLAFAIPYTSQNLTEWLRSQQGHPHVVADVLTQTDEGRDVPLLRVGCVDGSAGHRALITCRHHACESLASYVAEGLMARFLEDDEEGTWLREHVELIAVPFIDADGVEKGDQGKLRAPHDHWLDYGEQSLYAETQALQQRWRDNPQPVEVALDLHCPSQLETRIYMATGPAAAIAAEMTQLCTSLQAVQSGPLRYDATRDLPFGRGWNVAATYEGVHSFMHWAEGLPGVRIVATVETPYASVGEAEVTVAGARQFGADLATALARYLQGEARAPK